MSGVHGAIALQALAALPAAERARLAPYRRELEQAAWYPDTFADRTMTAAQKAAIDPEADRFIEPAPPRTALYRRILKVTEKEAEQGVAPLRAAYLAEHYLARAVAALRAGDARAAAKFGGVFSHIIGDITEPIHAIAPPALDLVLPPPQKHIGLELHAGVEGLGAPVNLRGYRPRVLGATAPSALMNLYAGLVAARDAGARAALPIVAALYAGRRARAVALSSAAQNAAARLTADFLHTVCRLARGGAPAAPRPLDLRAYPAARWLVDMLYRYRPMIDVSLIPYRSGRCHPLALRGPGGRPERVRGIGLLPYLGPPYTLDHHRETFVEYFLVPGAYRAFRARVGLNPHFREAFVTAVFRVLGDGRELYRSKPIRPRDPPVAVRADIGRVRWLTLAMHYATNPTFADVQRLHCRWATHGVWAEPILV